MTVVIELSLDYVVIITSSVGGNVKLHKRTVSSRWNVCINISRGGTAVAAAPWFAATSLLEDIATCRQPPSVQGYYTQSRFIFF